MAGLRLSELKGRLPSSRAGPGHAMAATGSRSGPARATGPVRHHRRGKAIGEGLMTAADRTPRPRVSLLADRATVGHAIYGYEVLVRCPPSVPWNAPDAAVRDGAPRGHRDRSGDRLHPNSRPVLDRAVVHRRLGQALLQRQRPYVGAERAQSDAETGGPTLRGLAPSSIVIELTEHEHEHVRDVEMLIDAATRRL
jgi:hypothetical protein